MRAGLLDTNALLWVLQNDRQLGTLTRDWIAAAPGVHFSAVSVLEISIKSMLGRLRPPDGLVEDARQIGLVHLSFEVEDAQAITEWPSLARHDPFDRMLLAQAARRRLRLVTSDRTLLAVPGADVLDARS